MTPSRGKVALFKKLALAAAICACSTAQAGILNFENPQDTPFALEGETYSFGEYWVQALGGELPGDLVGSFINGADQGDICVDIKCPVNNSSNYYAALNDGYLAFGLQNGKDFKLESFSASFMGTGQSSFPAVSGVVILLGLGADGFPMDEVQVGIGGPNANGQFSFDTINLGGFLDNSYSAILVAGFACDSSGDCYRNINAANFAFDDFVTTSIPEPATWGLLGLGLLGIGAFTRKRQA